MMERNKYPFIHFLRMIFILLAIVNVVASILLVLLFVNALSSGNDAVIALGLGVGFASFWMIPLSLFAAVLSMFMASVLKLFVDIQDNTWETANQMKSFVQGSKKPAPKQQPPNPPDGPIQINVD
jgi:hypothetical protein